MGRGGFFSVDSLRGAYVVVVEREPLWRGLLREVLEYCGALVTLVDSAKDALRMMDQICPNAVVVRLSDGDVLFLSREVRGRRQPDGRPVCIVAVGSHADRAALPTEAFHAFVAEPLDPWELCRVLAKLTQTG